MKAIFVLCLVTIFSDTLSQAEYHHEEVQKEFNFPDDDEDEGEGDMDIDSLEMESEDEQLLQFLSSISTPMEMPYMLSEMTFLDLDMLDESKDTVDEDAWTILLKQAYRFNHKLGQRSKHLDEISAEFNRFVINGFVISNNFFNLLEKLNEEVGANHEFQETVLNMMVQAGRNIESIHKVTSMYKKRIIQDLGKPESLPAQYNSIMSLHTEEMDTVNNTPYSMTDVLVELKGHLVTTMKKEKNILRLFRDFLEEQNNLIALGRKLWVNSHVDYLSDEDDGDHDDLGGGLKRNPTNEDILKQVLEVRRTRRAISAYSAFLKREGVQNRTSVKSQKDEL